MKRILVAGALCLFIVPIVLALYLGLSANPTMEEFGSAFVAEIPLGDVFYAAVVSATEQSAGAGITSSVDWFMNIQNISSGFLLYEYGQVFLVSIFVMALDKVLDGIFGKKGTVFGIEMIGDVLCKFPWVLIASLIADKIYGFCENQMVLLPLEAAERTMFTVAVISFVGGILAIFLAGGVVKSFLQCGLKLIVVSWTYMCCIMIGFSLAPVIMVVILWVLLVCVCEWVGYLIDALMK